MNKKNEIKNDNSKRRQNDDGFKRLISNPELLAEIAMGSVEEYRGLDVKDIRRYVNISDTPSVQSLNTEVINSHGGKTIFDSRFMVMVPNKETYIRMYLEIEAQANDYTDYPLDVRKEVYVAHMLADQTGKDYRRMEYHKVKRCYSIWIVMNPYEDERNSISWDRMERRKYGNAKDKETWIQNIVTINLGEAGSDTDNRMLKVLDTVFSKGMDDDERKDILARYDINNIDLDLAREVRETGASAEEVEMIARFRAEKAYKEGMEKGAETGALDFCTRLVESTMQSSNCDFEEAMEYHNLPEDMRIKVRERFKNKNQ